jgi:Tol biopolymer transport system component/predicted Ser/Thr protein kinase
LQRWRQIEELYHSACEHGVAVLDGADPEIRKQVERLLAHTPEDGNKLLDQRAADLISEFADAPITPGTQIGPYKIEAPIGEGGMGQVFRARDTRLSRPVAIKICKEEFIDRFEQEARSIAVISHPNICTLYDVGPNYLVMELVDGETLAARLKRGKLTPAETIRYGAQIAEGLAVAHAQGIVHRDLKPGNVMLTKSGVKVLDFGLAKSSVDPSVTAVGAVMGTPAYLAPERLEGKEADARSDIYALGLVLAEMLTAKRSVTPENVPPALDHVIKRCLERDPDQRWQSARDLKWELESAASHLEVAAPQGRKQWLPGAVAAAALLVGLLAAFLYTRTGPDAPPVTRVNVLLPQKALVRSVAVSPDGRFIAAVLVKDGKQQIWVRALDGLEMTPLAGTDNAVNPFWSPDSRLIAFFADAKLKKIERSGGPVQPLCDALAATGGTWNRDGDILIGALYQVMRVSDQGGEPTTLPNHPATAELFPSFLPDGRHYVAYRGPWGSAPEAVAGIWINSLDGSESKRLLPDHTMPLVVAPPASRSGAILFTRSGTLMALPMDMKRLEPTGEPFAVARNIAQGTNQTPLAASSYNGVLAYVSGQSSRRQYVWRDRTGKNLGVIGEAGGVVMISPDGKKLVGDPGAQITIQDLGGDSSTQVTVGSSAGQNPAWSPDGRYVAYNFNGIYRKATTGGSPEELLLRSKTLVVPKSWSPDGRYLIYAQINPGTGADLFALPMGQPNPTPMVLAQTKATEDQGQFSPDGHWVAYTSNESGESEIYVVPFPPDPAARRWVVSRGGGVMPRWRRDGKELFYVSPDWKMMAVDVATSPTFHSGTPKPLFDTDMIDTGLRSGPMSWDVAADGKKFLIISEDSTETSSLDLILNWRPEQPR